MRPRVYWLVANPVNKSLCHFGDASHQTLYAWLAPRAASGAAFYLPHFCSSVASKVWQSFTSVAL